MGAIGSRFAEMEADECPSSPVEWCGKVGQETWSKSREVLESAVSRKNTLVVSANGTGKSHLAAQLALFWTQRWRAGTAKVVITAPTARQVLESVMEKAIVIHALARSNGTPLRGKPTVTGYTLDPIVRDGARIKAITGFSPGETEGSATKSLGQHADHLLGIVDEGQGVNEANWKSVRRFFTSAGGHLVVIGNPDRAFGPFYNTATKDLPGWNVIRIRAHDCPAFTGEDVSEHLMRALTQPEWVRDMAEEFGEDSDHYRCAVDAEFPDADNPSMFYPGLKIREARDRDLPEEGRPRIGVDPAGGGSDGTEIAVAWPSGRIRIVTPAAVRKTASEEKIGDAMAGIARAYDAEAVITDGSGEVGVNAHAACRALLSGTGINVQAVYAGRKARRPRTYVNNKSEWHHEMRDRFSEGSVDLDPLDDAIADDFRAFLSVPPVAGRKAVEKKRDYKKRRGHSPDRPEAAILATVNAARAFHAAAG